MGRRQDTLSGPEQFHEQFERNLQSCSWLPYPRYSVFTQYDQEYYLKRRDAFVHKYRCFFAVSKTISPGRIIELGVSGGAGADAYLSASPEAEYVGIDVFGSTPYHHDPGQIWNPRAIAEELFSTRGFRKWELIQSDLRTLDQLPYPGDLVIVDAAHDFDNEYADLRLALTADPKFLFIDDAEGADAKPAVEEFMRQDVATRTQYSYAVPYQGGGLVVKLRSGD